MVPTTNRNLADTLENIRGEMKAIRVQTHDEIQALRAELQPVTDAYKAATIGAAVMKWVVGVLAAVGSVVLTWWQLRGH